MTNVDPTPETANKPAHPRETERFRWKPEPWQLRLKRRWYQSPHFELSMAASLWRYLCALEQRLREEAHPQAAELYQRTRQCELLCHNIEGRVTGEYARADAAAEGGRPALRLVGKGEVRP
ncbi:MAG TPA: hypothetical protein VFB62_01710 [Polyangiaceae bacterium]|nr:hypothetical protein [Polyangiaceae bacterium]